MSGCDERKIGSLIVRIDRTLCVGFGDCVDENEPAFRLADDGIAVFCEPEQVKREALIRACDACPVDALSYDDVKDAD